MKRNYLGIFFFCSFAAFWITAARAEFVGKVPTGLLVLEKKHPYCLFVPEEYTQEKSWPLLILLGKRGGERKDVQGLIDPWLEWAKKNQVLVSAIPNLVSERGDVPVSSDQWILSVKREIIERYKINPSEILLVGMDAGGHYAAYLGLKFPQEFSAAVLVGQAWPGPLERLMKPTSERKNQIPFYVAVDPKSETYSEVEAEAFKLEKKSYQIKLDPLPAGEDFMQRRDEILKWLHEGAETHRLAAKRPRKTWKDKTKGFLHDFFEV